MSNAEIFKTLPIEMQNHITALELFFQVSKTNIISEPHFNDAFDSLNIVDKTEVINLFIKLINHRDIKKEIYSQVISLSNQIPRQK